jgi:hypothetical protein
VINNTQSVNLLGTDSHDNLLKRARMEKSKKPVKYGIKQDQDTFMPPEVTGAMKRDNIFHWSIDELIEYRSTGVRPKMIIDETYIYKLARLGVSIKNICGLFGISEETFCNNQTFLSAHRSGRSHLATANRAAIVEHAANGSLDAQKYLDRYLGGDVVQESVNLTVSPRPLESVPTEQLIEIVYDEKDKK